MRAKIFQKLSFLAFFALIFGNLVAAQEQEEQRRGTNKTKTADVYIISAKAGGINYVSGLVHVKREATKRTQILAKSDELNDKDKVSTGENGKVEILLNPGSFLRLAETTDIEFINTALDSLKVKLVKGSALFEAAAVGGDGADVLITTPHADVRLEKSGIYRLNVNSGATEVWVWKGAASVAEEVIKGGRKAVYQNGSTAEVVKFEKDASRDAFDIWSKDRAKELAKLNERLEQRALARAFNGFSRNGFNDRFGSGFWAFNRTTGGYCFVPSGWNAWNSPYGFGYNRGISMGYGGQPMVVRPQSPQIYQNPNASSGSPSVGFPQNQSPSAGPSRPPTSDSMPRSQPSRINSKNAPINPN